MAAAAAGNGEEVKRAPSVIEETLALQIRALQLKPPVREYQFDKERKWRFDFAWPAFRVAAECEGGIHSGGRHTRATGFEQDCEKYNAATLAGWKVLRFTGGMVSSGAAIAALEMILPRGCSSGFHALGDRLEVPRGTV